MINKQEVQSQLKELENRINKLKKSKSELEKEQAVCEHQYDESVKRLLELGIDISKMSIREITTLLEKTELQFTSSLEDLESEIAASEQVVAEFKALQGV